MGKDRGYYVVKGPVVGGPLRQAKNIIAPEHWNGAIAGHEGNYRWNDTYGEWVWNGVRKAPTQTLVRKKVSEAEFSQRVKRRKILHESDFSKTT
jgi:hypothetical protein